MSALMDALPSDVEGEINSFAMFAPDLPVTAAKAMREHIKAETDGEDGDPHTGVMITFDKCGVVFQYEDNDEDGEIDPRIQVLVCPVTNKHISFPCSVYFHDEYTDDGLVRLINKCKPLIKDVEARGFCACGEDASRPIKRIKLTGVDMCGKCAFKAALST